MLTQIPRIPTFPEHMVNKVIKRIEQDVEDDVIPVSAGIYTEHKLMERLQAIPKPNITNYEDTIFFELVDVSKYPCKTNDCPLCGQEYGTKKNIATQCNFCGVWSCSSCFCSRKRYHPRAKENSSERYSICFKCDDKFLSLTLNHPFVQNKCLYEEVIKRIRREKDQLERECQKREFDSVYGRELMNKNKFKISSIKKEQIDLRKHIAKMQGTRQQLTMKLKIREKYLAILMKKKQRLKQINQEDLDNVESKPKKIKRALTQNIVFSQKIRYEERQSYENQAINQSEQIIQEQQTLQQKHQTNIINLQAEVKQQKINNFFNFHQWNHPEIQQRKNSLEENEETTFPESNQLSPNETQNCQSIAQKRLAQIFAKEQKVHEQYVQDSQEQTQSLDEEVIKYRKAALMKAAIEQSHKSRIQELDEELSLQKKKCSCLIY